MADEFFTGVEDVDDETTPAQRTSSPAGTSTWRRVAPTWRRVGLPLATFIAGYLAASMF